MNFYKSNCLYILVIVNLFFVLSCSSHRHLQKVSLIDGHTHEQHESYSKNIMIATQGQYSTQAGLDMIELGGNAFDAAAAISFAISVERPQSTGIGGGGFMLLDSPRFQTPRALDFREKAPIKSRSNMFLNKKGEPQDKLPIDGILASGVPGTVKGVLEMHEKYGKLSREHILRPAIKLATKGFEVYPHLAKALKYRANVLSRFKATKEIFFKDNRPLRVGERLVQKDLAKTLEAISLHGVNGFYKGWVARAIANEFLKRGGLISLKDLRLYNTKWREPVIGKYKDYDIYSMSPPSSGGTHVVQILNILEPFQLYNNGVQSFESIHKTASAMQLSFVDRAKYMGDSDFVKVPVKALTSKKYADKLRDKIKNKALKVGSSDLIDAFSYESDETTHFTVVDKEGNTVSSTQTINYWMGSGVVIPGTGVVMNDEMDDFSKKTGDRNVFGAVGSSQNLVAPHKRPLSSMSPTIIKKDGKTVLTLGTPSGTRILTCVAQVALNYLEHKLSLWDAVSALRYHHQWHPDEIRVEEPGFSREVQSRLEAAGHKVNRKNLGCRVQAIAVEKGVLHGVSDPRGEGMASGL